MLFFITFQAFSLQELIKSKIYHAIVTNVTPIEYYKSYFYIKIENMKERLLSNWSIIRVLYLVMGILIITQTAMSREWIGVAIGSYFAAMGLFSFGCASGNCTGGSCSTDAKKNSQNSIQDVKLEEIKVKS